MTAYHAGARRVLMSTGFQRGNQTHYKHFVNAAQKLWGYFDLFKNGKGTVYLSFHGVASAIEGKKILERKFADVGLRFSDERGRVDWSN
jgi:hypothetical protein